MKLCCILVVLLLLVSVNGNFYGLSECCAPDCSPCDGKVNLGELLAGKNHGLRLKREMEHKGSDMLEQDKKLRGRE